METGTIVSIVADRGFGFIRRAGVQKDTFFHVGDLVGGMEFDQRLIEMRVEFSIADSPKGPRAIEVRPVA